MKPAPPPSTSPAAEDDRFAPASRARRAAAVVSLAVSLVLLVVKYVAYAWTGSAAILSDALESIVNVVAAVFLLGGMLVGTRPADREHPYGHGKIEYFSAVFEGGLISFAAVLIAWYAVRDLVRGPALQQLEAGLLLTAAAGLVNAGLGLFLVREGRRVGSLALVADGKHVLSDFWTSVGVVGGLILVRLTGLVWLDPATALVVAVNLAVMGGRLVRQAAGGLLDEEDSELLGLLVDAAERHRAPGIIRIHRLRAIRAGRFTHIDAHVIVPEFWSVHAAHDQVDVFERRVLDACAVEGEIVFHTDPCRRALCAMCELADCPERAVPFDRRPPFSVAEARLTDEMFWGRHGRTVRRALRQPAP